MTMIAYEVRVTVEAAQCARFEAYMRELHIPQVLETEAFIGASFESSAEGSYRTRYLAHDREALERYLAEHAPRLRDDFASHFPSGVEVTREEWSVVATFA